LQAKVLYISYDGLTDPLGQSQILPYIIGLSKSNFKTCILSTEKPENFKLNKQIIENIVNENNISWQYTFYTKRPAIISTIIDIFKLKRKAKNLVKKQNFSIVHCRSYIPAFIGSFLKRKYNLKFIFDMRGFYADERAEGGIWNLKNKIYKGIYKYFKRQEIRLLNTSDITVSLTNNAKTIIESWSLFQQKPSNIEVIPCCADLHHFSRENIDKNLVNKFEKVLNLKKDDFIVSYIGSIGTWYMLDEMLDFFSRLLQKKKNAIFLFISYENQETIYNTAKKYNIPLLSRL